MKRRLCSGSDCRRAPTIEELKGMALGAHAVMVGRASLFGVAAAGEPGARHALQSLRNEIDRTLGMPGRCSFGEVDGTILFRA